MPIPMPHVFPCFPLLLKQLSSDYKNNRKGIKKKIKITIYAAVVIALQLWLKRLTGFNHMYVILKRKLNHLTQTVLFFLMLYIYHENLFILLVFGARKCWKSIFNFIFHFLQWHTSICTQYFLANTFAQSHSL